MDELAGQLGIDPLEFRLRNALRVGSAHRDVPGAARERGPARLPGGAAPALVRDAGGRGCAQRWRGRRPIRRGVGVAAMWYGIGNTSLPNPSEIEVGLRADGTVVLFSGATDIGQGSNTILAQIAADALGVPVASIERVGPDTDLIARRGQDVGLAPDVRVRERDPARGRGPAPAAAHDAGGRCGRDARDRGRSRRRRGTAEAVSVVELGELPGRGARLRPPRPRLVRPEDHAARRRRPGHPVRDLRVRCPGGRGRRRHRARDGQGAADRRGARRRAGPSTRRWSRARSRAASSRAWAWR